MTCALCGREISKDEQLHAYRRVVGWEKPRTQGGTNAVALREVTDVRAHASCVRLAADGIAIGQETLS